MNEYTKSPENGKCDITEKNYFTAKFKLKFSDKLKQFINFSANTLSLPITFLLITFSAVKKEFLNVFKKIFFLFSEIYGFFILNVKNVLRLLKINFTKIILSAVHIYKKIFFNLARYNRLFNQLLKKITAPKYDSWDKIFLENKNAGFIDNLLTRFKPAQTKFKLASFFVFILLITSILENPNILSAATQKISQELNQIQNKALILLDSIEEFKENFDELASKTKQKIYKSNAEYQNKFKYLLFKNINSKQKQIISLPNNIEKSILKLKSASYKTRVSGANVISSLINESDKVFNYVFSGIKKVGNKLVDLRNRFTGIAELEKKVSEQSNQNNIKKMKSLRA